MQYGYNIAKASELMEKIATAYNNLGIYTTEQWDSVYTALQKNWVGEDEQDYENKLATKICDMYNMSHDLCKSSIDTIEQLTKSWIEFQKNNVMTEVSGSKSGVGMVANLANAIHNGVNVPTITRNEKIVSYHPVVFTNDTNRGLTSESSASNIKAALETFVGQIKGRTSELFKDIETDNAFFGDQKTAIKTYIEKCGEAIGEVTVAIKDIYDAVDTLANTNYSTASSDVTEAMGNNTTNIESSLDELGASRWK